VANLERDIWLSPDVVVDRKKPIGEDYVYVPRRGYQRYGHINSRQFTLIQLYSKVMVVKRSGHYSIERLDHDGNNTLMLVKDYEAVEFVEYEVCIAKSYTTQDVLQLKIAKGEDPDKAAKVRVKELKESNKQITKVVIEKIRKIDSKRWCG
jgi:hypothetical protein